MNTLAWLLAVAVGLINIVFNLQAQRAAYRGDWMGGILSFDFFLLFCIGCCSLLVLYSLYAQQVPLARGILLMGAISIIGGTSFGVLTRGNSLDAVEWMLVAAICILFIYRFLRSVLG